MVVMGVPVRAAKGPPQAVMIVEGAMMECATMKIWIDADACPVVIKETIYRVSKRTGTAVTLVANQYLRVPDLPQITSIQVGAGADVADAEIVRLMAAGDIVVTADIPLASLVVEKGGTAINPRGEPYTAANISERLSMRDFMDELRSNGVETSGPRPFNAKDCHQFSNSLDRILAAHAKKVARSAIA